MLEKSILTADLPERVIHGFAIHSQMTTGSGHPTCSTDSDCAYLGSSWVCSDHFAPSKRCVASCNSDADCVSFMGYDCFPLANNPQLSGYCYDRPDPFFGDGYSVYHSASGWYNSALAHHKAYSNLRSSLYDLAAWHREVCDVPNSYDNDNGDYAVWLKSQCKTCDTGSCPNPPCPCDIEYSACPDSPASVGFGPGPVHMNRWYNKWAWTSDSRRHSAEFILGHELGHMLVGGAYGWVDRWPLGCVSESAADIYGILFAVDQIGTTSPLYGCNSAYDTDAWQDDRSGLNPGCYVGELKSYAYRSRFDLLLCSVDYVYRGTPCTSDSECPAYQRCDRRDDRNECYEHGDIHNGGYVFSRFVRILADGAGVLGSDGHSEIPGVPDDPIGRDATARVLSKAQRSLSGSADLEYWMQQVLFWASTEGYYNQAVWALGVAGFFPNRTYLDSLTADKAPVKYHWPDYKGDDHKNFTAYRSGVNIYVRYRKGGVPYRIGLAANTSFRPAIVGYKNYLHVYWRDSSTGKIYVYLMHKSNGNWYGPYLVDPGNGQLKPNGAFDATLWQGRVYLVFGDATNSSKLSLAWCDDYLACYRSAGWHDFGGGTYKKVVRNVYIDEGPSAVGNDLINGLEQHDDNLWIFYSELSKGRLWPGSTPRTTCRRAT